MKKKFDNPDEFQSRLKEILNGRTVNYTILGTDRNILKKRNIELKAKTHINGFHLELFQMSTKNIGALADSDSPYEAVIEYHTTNPGQEQIFATIGCYVGNKKAEIKLKNINHKDKPMFYELAND